MQFFLFLLLEKNKMFDPKLILSENKISKTKFRTDLLALFYNSKKSLSVEDILIFFNYSVNKATVYRSLDSFESKGLIHKVPDNYNYKRFSICKEINCAVNSHNNHGHFICYICDQTFCLDDMPIPSINNIKGYDIHELNLTAKGYCESCK